MTEMERHLSGGQGRLCNTAGGMTNTPQMVLEWRARDKVEAGVPTGKVIPQVQGVVFPEMTLFLMGIVQKRLSSLSCLSQASSPTLAPVFCYVPASPCSCLDKYLQIMRLMHLDSWEGKPFHQSPCGSQTLFITTPLMGPEAPLQACLRKTRFFGYFFFSLLAENCLTNCFPSLLIRNGPRSSCFCMLSTLCISPCACSTELTRKMFH